MRYEELIENNKLIAEFMGYTPNEYGVYQTPHGKYHLDHFSFHSSWDWLMDVVEKIESLGYEFFIVEDRVKIAHNTDHSTETIIDFTLGGSKRDATYNAVVKFINEYNRTDDHRNI